MKIDILTLFPEMFCALEHSILKKAKDKELFSLSVSDIRQFSKDKHKKCDDYPYGGGSGMVMTPQPLYDAIKSKKTKHSKVIYLSPKGKVFNQQMSKELAKQNHLIFVCGHYEGVDQRVIDLCVDEEISIGDYILTGGELPAMVIVDSLLRNITGVLGNQESVLEESFSNSVLEYPHYTRPQNFKGLQVPSVLLSGNHKKIEDFRHQQSVKLTKQRRPDLLEPTDKKSDWQLFLLNLKNT